MNRLHRVVLFGVGVLIVVIAAGVAAHRSIVHRCDVELNRLVDAHSGCAVRMRWSRSTHHSWGEPVFVGTVQSASRQAPWGGLFEARQLELVWGLRALVLQQGFERLSLASVRIPSRKIGSEEGTDQREQWAGLSWPSVELVNFEVSPAVVHESESSLGAPLVLQWTGRMQVDGSVPVSPRGVIDRAQQTAEVTLMGDVSLVGQVTLVAGADQRLSLPPPSEQTPHQPVASVLLNGVGLGVSVSGREMKSAGEPFELHVFAGAAGSLWVLSRSPFFQGALRLKRWAPSAEEAGDHLQNLGSLRTRADLVLSDALGSGTAPSPAAVDALLEEKRTAPEQSSLRIQCPDLFRACSAAWVNLPLRWLLSLMPDLDQEPLLRAVHELKLTGDGEWQLHADKQQLGLRVTGASGILHTAELRNKIESSLTRFVDRETLREAAGVLMNLPGPAGSTTLREWRDAVSPSAGPLEVLLPDHLIVDALRGAVQFRWSVEERSSAAAHASWFTLQSGLRTWESWHVTGMDPPSLLAAQSFPPSWPSPPATGGVRLGVLGVGHAELRLSVSNDLQSFVLALDPAEKKRLLAAVLAAGLGGSGRPMKLALPLADELKQIEEGGKDWLKSFIRSQDESATADEKEAARRRMKESEDTLKGALRKFLGAP